MAFIAGLAVGWIIGVYCVEKVYADKAKEGKATTFEGIPYKFTKIEDKDEAK
jgi:hypothetical protein